MNQKYNFIINFLVESEQINEPIQFYHLYQIVIENKRALITPEVSHM